MLGKLKEKLGLGGDAKAPVQIASPVDGEAVALSEVTDPTFGQGILGKGAAVRPAGNRVVSPVSGTVETIFETGHAVTLKTDGGAELLIHVGLDTVTLKGKHFEKHVQNGDRVRPGDPLITFDREAIAAAGFDTIIPIVVCNTEAYQEVTLTASGTVKALDALLTLEPLAK